MQPSTPLLAPDIRVSSTDLLSGEGLKSKGGVYLFYTVFNEPLYIGVSNNIRQRVFRHLSGRGCRDIKQYVQSGKPFYIEVVYEDNRELQVLLESYLIKKLEPRFNVQKTGRRKVV